MILDVFTKSDYLEDDPKHKLDVGLAHAFLGAFLAVAGVPLWIIAIAYAGKEIWFDLRRVDSWRMIADSIMDLAFTVAGAYMVLSENWLVGLGVILMGLSYFVTMRVFK